MAYCTDADLVKSTPYRFVTDLIENDGSFSRADMVGAAIAAADAYIDGILGARYSVPFSTVPAIISAWAAPILAAERLAQLIGNRTDEYLSANDAADQVRIYLGRVAAGSLTIPGASSTAASVVVLTGAEDNRDERITSRLDDGRSADYNYTETRDWDGDDYAQG